MKEENLPRMESSQTRSASTETQPVHPNPSRVRRRSFLKRLGMAGATLLPAGALLATKGKVQAAERKGKLSKGDVAILRLLAAAEIIETDLWQQYNELGGIGATGSISQPYITDLQVLDGDMPQYISDNTDDELSHAAFLNAYLLSKGAEPVNLDRFRTLLGSAATGADPNKFHKRLTNLRRLNVDLSWYTRYRSEDNPDLGASFKGPFNIFNEPGIPLDDVDTPPNMAQPTPPKTTTARRMQAIANTAGFHFAFIEQGGSSLYPTLALKATSEDVSRILLSIGGVEIEYSNEHC